MAVYQSNVMAKQTGANAGKLKPSELGGRVRVAFGMFTPDSAWAAGSVIELVRLPKGARILPFSTLHFEAGQDATLTVSVGDAGSYTRYYDTVTVGASESIAHLNFNMDRDYVLPNEDVIKMTTGTAALTAGKKIAFAIYYVVD